MSWPKSSCSKTSLDGLSSVTDDGGGHIFLVGGSNPEALPHPLCCCDACFVNVHVNDFNFTSELEERGRESVLVGLETGWTTSVRVPFTMALLSLSGALLLDSVCMDKFPDGFREDVRALLGLLSHLMCSPSVIEENKISVSPKKSYKCFYTRQNPTMQPVEFSS